MPMNKLSRHHHYISQCYLRGFTKSGSKKSKLTVTDLKQRKHFETIPRNVAGIRDFNRVDIEGVEPDAVERSLSSFEGDVASALKSMEREKTFTGDGKTTLLNFIALLSIRSPEMRENWRKSFAQMTEIMMEQTLATKERWEFQRKKLKDAGKEVNENVTYEDAKKFFDSKAYKIQVATERHLHLEFLGVEKILPYLFQRKWLLLITNNETGPFITTDNPVNLTWNKPDEIPLMYRNSPGHGLKGTQIYFPISKYLALIGEFDGREGVINANKELVATLNSKMLIFVYKQIYSPSFRFYFMGKDKVICEAKDIFNHIEV